MSDTGVGTPQEGAGTPVLALERVTGGYGGAEIIHEVSVSVGPGEIVVLVGPNGAGKSTVMNAVLGRLQLAGGRVSLRGRDITGTAPDRVVRQGVCYVPQTANVFPQPQREREPGDGGIHPPRRLSPPHAGDVRALSAARGAPGARLPEISPAASARWWRSPRRSWWSRSSFLLDEPTAGLSPRFRGDIFRVVREINARGVPVLMVEQNARQALGIADRGYVLVDGRNRLDGSGAALLADPAVGTMFLGGRGDDTAAGAGKPAREPTAPVIEFLNFYLIPGLVLGSIYALGAIGVTLTFGILRFANFAHGETMTLGAFIALSLASITGWHPFAVLPLAMAFTALAVLGLDRLFFRPLRHGSTIIPRDLLLRADADGALSRAAHLGREAPLLRPGH